MFKKLALTAAIAAAAVAGPTSASAQSFSVNGGIAGLSYTFNFGGITANSFWVDVTNTGLAGNGLSAFGIWTNTSPITSTLTNVTWGGGVTTSAGVSASDWTSNLANWSPSTSGGQFGSIANYDAAAGLVDNGIGGLFSGAPGGADPYWITAGSNAVRFTFSTNNTLNTAGLVVGFRSQGTLGSYSCGFSNAAGTAVVNNNYSCTTGGGSITSVPEPSTYALMGAGLLGIFGFARRRRNNA